jgi:hypothetical protein
MKKVAFIFIFIILPSLLAAQEYKTIRGIVRDVSTKEPLSFASISCQHYPIGTISNALGEFEFHFPASMHDTLIVSYLGYENYRIALDRLPDDDELTISLPSKSYLLREVIVKNEKPLTALQIIKLSIKNIEQNYAVTPFVLNGFYRCTTQVDEKYVSLLEAALNLYDSGYQNQRHIHGKITELLEIVAIRKSKTYRHENSTWMNDDNVLTGLLEINNVKYRNYVFDGKPHWRYKLDSITYYRDRPVYIISSGTYWTFKIYIDVETYAVYKIAVDVKFSGKHQKVFNVNDHIKRRPVYFIKTLVFKPYQGKLYLEYIHSATKQEYLDRKTDKVLYTNSLDQRFSVNNIITENIPLPDPAMIVDQGKSLEKQIRPYDAAFWKNYNIIKDSEIHQKLAEDLEREVTLQEQFRRQSQKNE